MDQEAFLTVADFARAVDRTPAAIRAAVTSGRILPATRTAGGVKLFTHGEVRRFLEATRARQAQRRRVGA